MSKSSRRQFILKCSSGLTLGILSQIEVAYSQGYNLAGFWRKNLPLDIRTSQVIAKAAVWDNSYNLRTTQVIAKTAVFNPGYNIQTTQVNAKVAVYAPAYAIQTTQVILKVAVLA